MTLRAAVSGSCMAATVSPSPSDCQARQRAPAWAETTLAQAVMQPAPPRRRVGSSSSSEPGNTAKPGKRSAAPAMFSRSPELSFMPTMVVGYSFRKRSIRS